MRERTVFSARSMASTFLSFGIACFESSTSRARYVPPFRSSPRFAGVFRQLRNERVHAVESSRVSEPTNELHGHGFSIPVFGRIEHVDLDRPVEFGKGRPRSKIHHPAKGAACHVHAHRVYPF